MKRERIIDLLIFSGTFVLVYFFTWQELWDGFKWAVSGLIKGVVLAMGVIGSCLFIYWVVKGAKDDYRKENPPPPDPHRYAKQAREDRLGLEALRMSIERKIKK